MFFAEKMCFVRILALQKDASAVADAIARAGSLHPGRIEDVDAWAESLPAFDSGGAAAAYAGLRQRLARLSGDRFEACRALTFAEGDWPRPAPVAEIDEALSREEAVLLPAVSALESLETRRNELRELHALNEVLRDSGYPLERLGQSRYVLAVAGVIAPAHLEKLRHLLAPVVAVVTPYAEHQTGLHVLCVVLRKDRGVLERALKAVSFHESAGMDTFSRAKGPAETANTLARLEAACAQRRAEVARLRAEHTAEFVRLLRQVEAGALVLGLRERSKLTGKSCVLAGWAPAKQCERLARQLAGASGGRVYVEVEAAESLPNVSDGSMPVPVLLEHPRFLKPFEGLINLYGTPAYRSFDPTFFSFLAFLVMFGMMFGDVGHGLVLVAAGIAVLARFPAVRDVGKLLLYAGGAASVFGVLFGSVFGVETLLPALWVRPSEGLDRVFTAAIGFGVVMLSGAIAINTLNAVRTRSFAQHFFEATGPLGGILYWIGLAMVVRFLNASMYPASVERFLPWFGGLLLLFFLKGPALRVVRGEGAFFPGGMLDYTLHSAVDVLELIMGYLANTVSFIRVAAFGLAHTGLCVAVIAVSGMVAEGPGGFWASALVLVAGNALVVVFEGAVVVIQILRLEYYEFFSKFFMTFGERYAPVRYAEPAAEPGG